MIVLITGYEFVNEVHTESFFAAWEIVDEYK